MSRLRTGRVREEIKKEASDIIRKMKDPRIGFVTVTDVEVSEDLRHVKVFVSIYGDEAATRSTMEALQNATGFVRSEIGKRIRLRHTPEIHFEFDESIARGARVLQLLNEVKAEAKGKTPNAHGPASRGDGAGESGVEDDEGEDGANDEGDEGR